MMDEDSHTTNAQLQRQQEIEARFESEVTFHLVRRARRGDDDALEELCRRYLPRLRRWAAGRLPPAARDMVDTDDMVQEVLSSAARRLHKFEYRHERAFNSYLRRALHNRVLREVERTLARPEVRGVPSGVPSPARSPLEEVVGKEFLDRYERALAVLGPMEKEAIIGRLEMGLRYADLADTLDRPSAEAARKLVSRALLKLAQVMSHEK